MTKNKEQSSQYKRTNFGILDARMEVRNLKGKSVEELKHKRSKGSKNLLNFFQIILKMRIFRILDH